MATSMAMRRLGTGSAALTVSAQGFGCMGMTANYGECPRKAERAGCMGAGAGAAPGWAR